MLLLTLTTCKTMNLTNAFVWALVVLTYSFALLLQATESRDFKIRRLRDEGYTWKQISLEYGVSQATVRRWSLIQ